jgi:mono/diheme cytochrome c family protein
MLVLAGLVLVAAGCGALAHMSATAGDPVRGKQFFTSGTTPACASCHTLAADRASGVVGPNLDAAFGPDRCQGFSQSTIQDVVRGQIAYADPNPGVNWPPNSTNPVAGMPPGLANGQKAMDIAAYVASVAGITHGPGPHWDCQTGTEVG